ncbi:MAG: lysostaphin resistance A-like protein [Gammaproteobacteria bacterium]
MARRTRIIVIFAILWLRYQSAERVGEDWLHSFSVQAGLMLACVLAAWPLSRWLGYRAYGAYALDGYAWRRWLPSGLILAVLAKFRAVWLGLQLGIYAVNGHAVAAPGAWIVLLPAVPMLLVSTFVPSIAEDTITRGFWYRAAGICWRGGMVFVLVSATIYGLNHIYRLHRGPLAWLLLFAFGPTYAAALWRTGSLWAALALHLGWNLANGLTDLSTPVHVVPPRLAGLLSIGAHLLMLAVVCALPLRRPKTSAASN